MPVFQERELHTLGNRTGDFDMGIAPCADIFVQAQVFVAYVQAANPCHVPVHDHDLAVVPEVYLPAVIRPMSRVEHTYAHASLPELAQNSAAKARTADFVIKHINPN